MSASNWSKRFFVQIVQNVLEAFSHEHLEINCHALSMQTGIHVTNAFGTLLVICWFIDTLGLVKLSLPAKDLYGLSPWLDKPRWSDLIYFWAKYVTDFAGAKHLRLNWRLDPRNWLITTDQRWFTSVQPTPRYNIEQTKISDNDKIAGFSRPTIFIQTV